MFSRKNLLVETFKSLSIIKTRFNLHSINQVKCNSTFHKWTLDYFRVQPRYNKFVLNKPMVEAVSNSVDNYIRLDAIPTDELLIKLSSVNVKSFRYGIDQELLNRVKDMSVNQILALMDICLSDKNQLSKISRALRKCIEVLDDSWFRRPDLTASQTLQLIYYISIYKIKSKPTVELGLHKLMNEINYLKHLTDEELSVLAVATYKSSSKVNDKILRIFAFRVEKNLETLMLNPMYFVALIKPLKKAKYHDPILLNKIINSLNNNKNNKIFTDVISSLHLLSYFADANCSQVTFLQNLIDSIGSTMIKDSLKNYRLKDVSNYVFSASYLGLSPKDPNVCKIIVDFLDEIFNTKEKCEKMSKVLIGMCLSMWMLDHKPIKLMQFIFSNLSVQALRMPNAHKQDNRLNLLLTCARIEQPDLITQCQLNKEINSMPDVYTHLGERPILVKVYQALQTLSHKLDVSKIEYNFSIPFLKILGITINFKNNSEIIHVEVLDNSTCLYDTDIPNGMMKLKFRLESKLNFKVITINHKEIESNNSTSLKCRLESLLL